MATMSRRVALKKIGKMSTGLLGFAGITGIIATNGTNTEHTKETYRADLEMRLRTYIKGELTRNELQSLDDKAGKVATLDNISRLTENLNMLMYQPRRNLFSIDDEIVERDSLFDYIPGEGYRVTGLTFNRDNLLAVGLYKGSKDTTLAHEIAHVHHLQLSEKDQLVTDWKQVAERNPINATPTKLYAGWKNYSSGSQDGFITPYAMKGFYEETTDYPGEDIATLFTDVYKELSRHHKNQDIQPQDNRLIDKVALLRDNEFISTNELNSVQQRYQPR